MKLNCYRPRVLQMDQARSPLGTQHHQPPPPPSLESENETVDVESVSADVSSVSVDQSPLPMALPSHLDIEDDKQMDSTVLRQIMNIVVSLQPNQGAICCFYHNLFATLPSQFNYNSSFYRKMSFSGGYNVNILVLGHYPDHFDTPYVGKHLAYIQQETVYLVVAKLTKGGASVSHICACPISKHRNNITCRISLFVPSWDTKKALKVNQHIAELPHPPFFGRFVKNYSSHNKKWLGGQTKMLTIY